MKKALRLAVLLLLAVAFAAGCSSKGGNNVYTFPKDPDPVPVNDSKFELIYVSPDYSGESKGTLSQPYKTLEEAKAAVKVLKQQTEKDIKVYLRGGRYEISETVNFGLEDGGDDSQKVIYSAYGSEKPIITAAKEISGWSKVSSGTEGVRSAAAGSLYVADVPKLNGEKWNFKTLYRDGKMLPRASSPIFGASNGYSGWYGYDEQHKTFYSNKADIIKDWSNINDIELLTIPSAMWAFSILPLASTEPSKGIVKTTIPSRYILSEPYYWHDASEIANFENSIEFIDDPDEWCINTYTEKVYYYSPDGNTPQGIYAPTLIEYFHIEGDVDFAGKTDTPVKNLHFSGITFTEGERVTFPADFRGKDLQHGWDLYDYNDSLIRFRGAENCSVQDCILTESGSDAIRLDLHAQNNLIKNNLISNMGFNGIVLAGYGPGAKDVNHDNEIVGNLIRNIGTIYKASLGIFVWQSGSNRIANNQLVEMPYSGIVVSGRIIFDGPNSNQECSQTVRYSELSGNYSTFAQQKKYLFGGNNVIEYNDLSQLVCRLADGNGIYISGTDDNNKVYRNYVHDTHSEGFSGAIRMDDNQYDTYATENIVYNTGEGNGIENKQRNYIENNFVIDLKLDPSPSFGFSYLAAQVAPLDGTTFKRNICYARQEGSLFYDRCMYEVPGFEFNKYSMELDNNIYHSTVNSMWANGHLADYQDSGQELNSIKSDPMFYDVDNRDFRLRPGSPAFALGITQFDHSRIGLLSSFRYGKDGALDSIFVRAGNATAAAQMRAGEEVPLSFIARSVEGVVLPLGGSKLTYEIADESIAAFTDLKLKGLKNGKTTVKFTLEINGVKRYKTMEVIVGDNAVTTNEIV